MTRLWIVRHGNTFAPGVAPRRIGARTDLPLVESGRAQGLALRRWFEGEGIRFSRILSSGLRRSDETARLIAGDAAAIEIASWLNEIDHGPDEDRPEAEVVRRIGEEAIAAWDREAVAPPGWSVNPEARLAGWRDLMREAAGDLLLVTSNGAARFALLAQPSLTAAAPASLKLRTGALARIDREDDGSWRVGLWDERP